MAEDVFKVLNDRDHTLLRGHIMLGSMVKEPYTLYVDGKLETLNIVPGLLKIVFELIDNTVDEHIRSDRKFATKVSITMTPTSLQIEDNGRGIPVEEYTMEDGTKELRPVLCWTRLRSGTSFEGHSFGPSANGVGSSISCIFSSSFAGETCDGKKWCRVVCTDNMADINYAVEKAGKRKKGTKVLMEPDFGRFGVKSFSKAHMKVVRERLEALAAIYQTMQFTFNDEKIKVKKRTEWIERFKKPYVYLNSENWFFGIMPTETDEYSQVTYLEGLHVKNGGTIESWIAREICAELRILIRKKHKLEMSPGEIKRGLLIAFNGSMFPDMKFDSQTKERMVNSEAEVRQYFGEIDFEKLAKQVMNTPEIIDPILEAKLAKQIAAEKRAVTMAQKKQARAYIEKFIPAKTRNPYNRNLYLVEGFSAVSQAIRVRDVERQAFYPLRGMPMNVYGMKETSIVENKELSDIMAILGLRFGMDEQEISSALTHSKICLLADGDLDGAGGIVPLLINFFSLWPGIYSLKKIWIVPSPRYVLYRNQDKKNEERDYCWNKEEFEEKMATGHWTSFRYVKGLGSLNPVEYKEMLADEDRYLCVDIDDMQCIRTMFASECVDERRKVMES